MTNPPSTLTTARVEEEPVASDAGYQKTLANFQIQMIAFGGAIGVGLFLGSAGALHRCGPGLVLAYALAGVSAFFVMRPSASWCCTGRRRGASWYVPGSSSDRGPATCAAG